MKRILVALDGSEHSDKALDLASDLAAKHGAELVLLHVIPDRPLSDAERRMAETEYLEEVVTSADVQSMLAAGGDPRLTAERLLSHSAGVARRFHEAMGEFVLPYEAVRTAEVPDAALLAFLQSTYEAAAEAGEWDRTALECPFGEPGVAASPSDSLEFPAETPYLSNEVRRAAIYDPNPLIFGRGRGS